MTHRIPQLTDRTPPVSVHLLCCVCRAPTPACTAKDLQSAYPDNGFDCADDLDQATGLQHAELVADLQGKPFFQESLISGPFGTVDNPVKIESTIGYRIVGCTGAQSDAAYQLVVLGFPFV
eukprot:SAG31_NODE_508_length_14732_cov_75.624547_5_plen_121_part_00